MNPVTNTMPESISPAVSGSALPTHPFRWSVRRELWENHSIYIVPLVVAIVQIFGFAVSTHGMAARRRAALLLDPAAQRARIGEPYDLIAMMMIFTVFVVGIFYCLDALYGERRDRSILFWKSLPVSDVTAVLAKVTIPLLVLPLIAFVTIACTQLVILFISSIVLSLHGISPATTLANYSLTFNWIVLLYGLGAIALWHAPVYGWFLLVSAWVRRAAFLWAILPFIAASIFEKITFGTSYFGSFIRSRLMGFAPAAFDFHAQSHPVVDSFAQFTPVRYLTSPGLWVGLVLAAAFLAGAIRLRRSQGPV
jgi:ABC-2 type transport system permease protein